MVQVVYKGLSICVKCLTAATRFELGSFQASGKLRAALHSLYERVSRSVRPKGWGNTYTPPLADSGREAISACLSYELVNVLD